MYNIIDPVTDRVNTTGMYLAYWFIRKKYYLLSAMRKKIPRTK